MNATVNTTVDCDKYESYRDWYYNSGPDAENGSVPYIDLIFMTSACPEFCRVLYGTGNPDLAGIGVSNNVHLHLSPAAQNLA